ncbi:MAG: Gfo/Idh/MocA family oxidoreductase [Kiritimatiellia bacterium]
MKTVAVIGCGKRGDGKVGWAIGHAHARGYLGCGHEVKLLGVDVSPDNLKAFGEAFGLPADQLFSSTDALYAACTPDAVSICTWPKLHHPMVVEALEKGVKGIACEKPFTIDVGELRDLEKRVADKGAVLVIAHQRRLEAGFRKLKEVACGGSLGSPLTVRALVGDGWDILSWTTHWFDMANFMFDGRPDYVLAGMDMNENRRYQHAVEDASIIYASYGEKGSATFLTGPETGARFDVQGPEGIARIGDGVIEVARFDGAEKVPFDKDAAGGFVCLIKEMLDALDGGPEPMCSIGHSAMATEMAYAAQESARTGRKITLPLAVHYAPLEVAQHPVRSALAGKQALLYADAHFGSGGREGIAEALAAMTGQAVRSIPAEEAGIPASDLAGVDVLVIYHTQKDATEETRAALTAWVEAGKPLLILHAGLGAWPDWDEYLAWCGKVWEWGVSVHPHEPAPLKVVEGDPLGFGWSEAWLPKDEVFVKLKDTAPVIVGVTTEISIGVYEVAWRSAAHPHVGAWMPGHRRD